MSAREPTMPEDDETVARMTERARAVADEIVGTAKSLHEAASDEEIDSRAFNAELDLRVFCCERCGWWCSAEEEAEDEDGNCEDCAEDRPDG
jgi:hypothetical protein